MYSVKLAIAHWNIIRFLRSRHIIERSMAVPPGKASAFWQTPIEGSLLENLSLISPGIQ